VRIAWALLAAGCLLAQEQQPGDEQANDASYTGPSISSRDKSPIQEGSEKLLDYRYWVDVSGVYDSGLAPVTTNAQGKLVDLGGTWGTETGFGATASRRWKRDKLTLEYKGAYRHYSTQNITQGLDQFLNLTYSRELSRRFALDVKATAGSVSLANGTFSYLPLSNVDLFALPLNELFDIRTRFAQSTVDVVWRKTARLSFSVGGEGFVVRRSSLLLSGLDGYDAHANIAYQLTSRQTVTGDYSYTYFDFQRAFGHSKLQTASLRYAVRLSRMWDLNLRGGSIRVDSLGLMQVAIDPAIAAIVGENFANVTFLQTVYLPLAETRLTRRFDRSSLTLDYTMGATPGNGVYLTSRQDSGTVGYSYAGFGRWTLGANAGYNQFSALGQALGKYTNLQGGTGVSYRLGRETHIQLRYDYRHYTTGDYLYQKDSNRVSLGVAFSPGERPLPIW